jgi:hypothetical protein
VQRGKDTLGDDAGVEIAEESIVGVLAVEDVARDGEEAAETEGRRHPVVGRAGTEHLLSKGTPRCAKC